MSFTLAVDFTVLRLEDTPVLTLDKSFSDYLIKDKQTKQHQHHRQCSPTDTTSDPMLHPVNGSDHSVVDSSDPSADTFEYILGWIFTVKYLVLYFKRNVSSDPSTYTFQYMFWI